LIGALGHDRPATPQPDIALMYLEKTIEVVTKLAAEGAI
jgi:hypothetical protein